MQERLLGMAGGAARAALVAAALMVAFSSIGVTLVRGFCPEVVPGSQVQTPTEAPTSTPSDVPSAAASDVATDDDGAAAETATSEPVPSSDCPGGADRCLPPMISGILDLGTLDCHEQAASRMRGTLLPAMLVATALLGGAWALRPRYDGAAIISRD